MVQRYNPDYVMHAARFAPFAREAEHGEYVKFSDYEALVSELASSRQINAQTLQVKLTMAETIKELTDRVNALAVERDAARNALASIYKTVTGEHPEWSNWHAYLDDIVEEVGAAIAANQTADALALENAALKRERSELSAIGELIRTQDNRLTDQPFFAVMTKREIVASEDHDCDRICWVENQSGNYVEATETQHRRLEAIYQAKYEVRDGWDRYAMKEIDVFVTGCFTEQGCKDYINKNGHNLNKPFIYAFGSYHNDEYQTVRKFIMQMPETPATDAALAAIEARFCGLLDNYGKVEPERFNPEFADLYAKIVNRIFSSVLDNPSVTNLESLTDWLENSAENTRAYADMSIKFHVELREGRYEFTQPEI